ncbi:probable GPI-anchored adhesin-like protein PGA55 isoform X2 [Aristolochia californica]|uniref:probable GPI-anchored adhesin-like protein PGA55 isoform X2 n=1 Tax=Aristolochia californica TaxID=171875 RepID=UPI0035DC742B
MASLAMSLSPSPSSFQLRLGFRSKTYSYCRFRMNCRVVNRFQLRASSPAGSASTDGSEGDNNFQRNSWTNSEKAADSFSGWLGKDDDDSLRMGKVRGAGLAAIFLVAGVAFASFSLKQRSNSGLKLQTKLLTSQQEELVASEGLNGNLDKLENESKTVLPDEENLQNDCIAESKEGTDQEPFTAVETSEGAAFEHSSDHRINISTSLVHIVEPESKSTGASLANSCQEDQQCSPTVNISVSDDHSPPLSESFESDVLSFSDSCTITTSDTLHSISELKNDLDGVESVDSPNPDTRLANFSFEHEAKNLYSPPSDFPFDSASQSPSHPLPLDASLASESFVSLNLFSTSTDVAGTATFVSSKQDVNLDTPLQLPSKVIDENPELHNLNGKSSSAPTFSSPALDDSSYENEQDLIGDSVTDRSRMFFDSAKPENSFSYAGIPAPSLVSAALQVPPGKVVVPAVIDNVQGQALAALQVLKVIEADVRPGDLCTRREYARWLVSASSILSRNSMSKVYPAMYIENVSELAFDDVTPEDPDFPSIQGLAEAGLISSKLSKKDMNNSSDDDQGPILFSPESPLSRQDLVSWKIALEKKHFPQTDKQTLSNCSGFLDIDRINPEAWPALAADISAGEQGIIVLAFGYTRLFQPEKPVTKAQAAIALATGDSTDVVGEELARIEAEAMAETAVAAHTALVAQVEKDINANFEKELAIEREKIEMMEKLAEEARQESAKLRAEREEQKNALIRGRASVESEMEVLSRLRCELEEQLEALMYTKAEVAFEKERINKLRKDGESENKVIAQLQYEVEVERKALSMARAWAEDEARRAREQVKVLEEARGRWESLGLKVVVEDDLRGDIPGVWVHAGESSKSEKIVIDNKIASRAKNLVDKLKAMAGEMKLKSTGIIENIIQKIEVSISSLRHRAAEAATKAGELPGVIISMTASSVKDYRENAARFTSSARDGLKRIAGDCREGMMKFTQKFKE